jgi:protein-disulfide isomerase
VSVIVILRAVQFQKTHYRVGEVPQDVVNQLLPKDIPLSALRPPAIRQMDPIRYGNATSLVSIIEYGDYECEYCKQMAPIIQSVAAQYGGDVRFVWRDLPNLDKHNNALPAAIFARCASLQGKYWQAYDLLMSAEKLNERTYDDIAEKIPLDIELLDSCRADKTFEGLIKNDLQEARADGIKGAPLIFVGTQAFEGVVDAKTLKDAVDKVIKGV